MQSIFQFDRQTLLSFGKSIHGTVFAQPLASGINKESHVAYAIGLRLGEICFT